ncbi:hypothetical protein KR222_007614, partial [Zaprionus bogoriensis]
MTQRSTKPVWLLFKLLEVLLATVCCYRHMECLQRVGIPHIFILCATYGSCCIVGVLNCLGSFLSDRLSMRREAIISGIFGFLSLLSVFAHMYLAEHDAVLAFLRDSEEYDYVFLECCKLNAHLSIYAAALYFLHCTLAMDMMMTRPQQVVGDTDSAEPELRLKRTENPLHLYFISKSVETYLLRFKWFQLISVNFVRKA